MKHESPDAMVRAFAFAGLARPKGPQMKVLAAFHHWLGSEATEAGMIGPNEGTRLWTRHIGDSATFAVGWRGGQPPPEIVDLGSGAGLPGIPLAVVWPDTSFRLVDRSESRCRVLRRGLRVMGLKNATVECSDATTLSSRSVKGLVMRAFLPPKEAVRLAGRLLAPGATAVIGGGRPGPGRAPYPADLMQIPSTVLDGSASLLIMTRRD